MSRRSAPTSEIVSVERIGPHGTTVHRHFLACGHFQDQPRWSKIGRMNCVKCSMVSNVGDEITFERVRYRLADKLGISPDDVNLTLDAKEGRLTLKGATVFLSEKSVRRLTRR